MKIQNMKIRNSKNYVIIALALIMLFSILFNSCDIIEAPYRRSAINPNPNDSTKTKILLEEFTAHRCQNCPEGAKEAHRLEEYYKDRLYIVSIHSGFNARPVSIGNKYTYDFRTTMGEDINKKYQIDIFGTPSGFINRTSYGNDILLGRENWQSAIIDLLEKTNNAPVKISIEANYNENNKKIDVKVDLNYLSPQITENRVTVWILEDSIVNWQLYGNTDIPDYVHNNVLRYSFNGTWGEKVSETAIASGFTFTKNYSYTIPPMEDNTVAVNLKDWKPENLKIIVFVYDDENGIKQVEQVKLRK